MATLNSAVLTAQGIALLAKAQAGRTNIRFTKAATGDGSYLVGESLVERKILKAQKQVFPISTISIVNSATVYLKFIISNKQPSGNLAAGYYVKEIGIFAHDPNEGEILYAIATAVINQWDYLPAYNDLLPSTITIEFYTEVNNAETVYLKAGGGASVTQEDFEKYVKDTARKQEVFNEQAAAIAIMELKIAKTQLKRLQGEVITSVLTNTQEWPFNNSQRTLALVTPMDNLDYIVDVEHVADNTGAVGEIRITDKQLNGFKIAYTGTAKRVTVKCIARGGST